MMPPLRSFDDVDEKERGQKKTDDLRAMTTLGPRTLQVNVLLNYCKQNITSLSLLGGTTEGWKKIQIADCVSRQICDFLL